MTVVVEATGETVGEAKWHALRELERLNPGLDKAAVRFEVVSEGERGLLGVGYAPARVLATIDAAAIAEAVPQPPRDEAPAATEVRALVEEIAFGIGVSCRVEVADDGETVTAICAGADLGLLIGKRGQTIDAIQYLASAVVWRLPDEERRDVVVDAAGYRERRRATLDALSVRSAERVLETGEPIELEPMSPVERKVVHLRLKEFGGVETTSEGAEPNRHVVVRPASPLD